MRDTMPVWFQKVALAFTIGVLVLVIALPVFHIVGNPSKQDTVAQMYVSMFPQVGENNAEALLDSFITAPDGSLTLLPAKDISVRGYLIGTTVRIIYLGGRDDALLSSIGIFIHRSGDRFLSRCTQNPNSTSSIRSRIWGTRVLMRSLSLESSRTSPSRSS